ncbi:MAG: helix-turn-helix domain-containing protein [Caldimonas sp.]
MNEAASAAAGPVAAPSAGRLLREARERQGLHIAALAASIKVTQKKLELLEADRFDALPDATFARALALTVCRALKMDSDAVLRLLPPPAGHRLEQVGEGLNAPFRERPGVLVQRDGASFAFGWVFWITTLILVAAAATYFLPVGWLGMVSWRTSAAVPASVGSSAATTPPPLASPPSAAPPLQDATPLPVMPTASAVVGVGVLPGPAESTAAPDGAIQVRTSAPSWIEVTDSRGRALLSRLVQPGEALGIDGEAPFRVRVGNAAGTELSFRGRPVELAASRDNVASVELK